MYNPYRSLPLPGPRRTSTIYSAAAATWAPLHSANRVCMHLEFAGHSGDIDGLVCLRKHNPGTGYYGYVLDWGCEGFTHPTTYYRKSDQYYWRSDVACAPEFSYAWFPELWYRPKRDDPARKKVDGWPNPTDSATRPMFRLPAVDITQVRACIDSLFSAGEQVLRPQSFFTSQHTHMSLLSQLLSTDRMHPVPVRECARQRRQEVAGSPQL